MKDWDKFYSYYSLDFMSIERVELVGFDDGGYLLWKDELRARSKIDRAKTQGYRFRELFRRENSVLIDGLIDREIVLFQAVGQISLISHDMILILVYPRGLTIHG